MSDFRQNSDDPAHIVMFLANTLTNPAEAPEISEDKLFNAASIMILQRIVAMFVKSKQQIIREQLQLKARQQSTSLRQTLRLVIDCMEKRTFNIW